jgi:3-hydroxybutyryl-CoA dehydrogenase
MIDAIKSVAVVGAGYMGGGIAQSLAAVGFPVRIADVNPDATQAALTRLRAEAEDFERAEMWPAGSAASVKENLSAAASITAAVAEVDYIEEAVFEVPEVKHQALAEISANCRLEAIIGSNTSTIPVRVLAKAVQDPSRFLTVHWSNPAPFIPGVELVVGEQTDPAVLPPIQELLRRAGRESAIAADRPGFVLNRLQYVLLKEACAIVEEGVATIADVDTIVRTTFGFRLPFFGPFLIADMAGLDTYANGFRILEAEFGARMSAPALITQAVSAGKHGLKNGAGLTGEFDAERTAACVSYRTRSYGSLARLLAELPGDPARQQPEQPKGE